MKTANSDQIIRAEQAAMVGSRVRLTLKSTNEFFKPTLEAKLLAWANGWLLLANDAGKKELRSESTVSTVAQLEEGEKQGNA